VDFLGDGLEVLFELLDSALHVGAEELLAPRGPPRTLTARELELAKVIQDRRGVSTAVAQDLARWIAEQRSLSADS
jgi:hypothetical protein